ncbi:uncharacterized protein LOC143204677 [Rhynchophorus ferrugineus]|uniref:uncharacterized protein LOC143204677 n=1 Tax=Rhynchophorus ferrugineus TaxID=354439 RepID=UPI003FCC57F2
MFSNVVRFGDEVFKKGLNMGDPLYFVERIAKVYFSNSLAFVVLYVTFIFSALEVFCQLYLLLTEKPDLLNVFQLAPMCLTSLYVLISGIPLMMMKDDYQKLICQARQNITAKIPMATPKTIETFREIYYKQIALYILFFLFCMTSVVSFLPTEGIDVENTIWPSIALLRLFPNDSGILISVIVAITYGSLGSKGFCLIFYGIHFMHLCTLYQIQSILLQKQLEMVNSTKWNCSDLVLNDNEKYQEWVRIKIRRCIMEHITFLRFGKFLKAHFKYPLLLQIFNGVLLLTILFYITYYLRGGVSPIGFSNFMVATFAMIFVFAYHSELYSQQDQHILSTVFEVPWYTFGRSNRKMFLILAMNVCPRENYLSGGGIFSVNFNLFIWMLHKVVNLLTIMTGMVDNIVD